MSHGLQHRSYVLVVDPPGCLKAAKNPIICARSAWRDAKAKAPGRNCLLEAILAAILPPYPSGAAL
jgi:hypothetical protein